MTYSGDIISSSVFTFRADAAKCMGVSTLYLKIKKRKYWLYSKVNWT